MTSLQWIELAEEQADNSRPKLYLAGGMFGALLAGSLLNPLTAVLVLAWGAYAAYRANETNSDLLEAIDAGILAPVMDKKQLREYRAAVGDEVIQGELRAAIAQELPLSPAAAAVAKGFKGNLALPAAAVDSPFPVPVDPAPESLPPAIGPDTRLNAVDVPSTPEPPESPVDMAPAAVPPAPPAPALPVMPVMPPPPAPRPVAETVMDVILSSPYQSRAIFGSQRTGKSYLAALASAEMSSKGTRIYHLNLASVGTEDDAYWTHTTRSVRCDLTKEAPRAAAGYIQQACDLVQQWWAQDDSILIVDEWAHLGGRANGYNLQLEPLLKMIADKISAVSSTGIKRRRAIWTIAPEFVAGDLQQDAKAVKKLALLLLAIPKGKTVDWHGSSITFNEELYDQISRNYPIAPFTGDRHLMGCDRCGFVDGLWMPLGTDGYSLPVPAPMEMATVGATSTPQRYAPAPAALPTFPKIYGMLDRAKAQGKEAEGELLEWLIAQGQGAKFTTQAVVNGAWAKKWQDRGLLRDRKVSTLLALLRKVERWGIIAARFDNDSISASNQYWEVTLK